MSSMAALVLASAAASLPPAGGLTAEQAMANYRAMVQGTTGTTHRDCPTGSADAITVCARGDRPPPRLPLPDERAEAGETVRHAGEFSGDPGPPTGPPSKQRQTVLKGFGLLKSLVTGEDPNPE